MPARTPRVSPEPSSADGHEGQEQRAYDSLRELIVDGRLAPGCRVMAAELAKPLDVGGRVVIAALHRLGQEGLVRRASGGHSRWLVTPVTVDGFREVVEVIGVLEAWAGRSAALLGAAPRGALVAELRATNAQLRAAAVQESPDHRVAGDLDHRFHDLATRLAGPQIVATLEAYRPRLERYVRSYMGYLVTDVAVSAEEHEAIVDAIEDGDPDAAEHAIRVNRFGAIERYAGVVTRVGPRGR